MKQILLLVLALCFFGCKPADGVRGEKGETGNTGAPGSSCSVNQLVNGAEIVCGDQTSAVILNGVPGPRGEDLVAGPYTVVELINPCGKQGNHDEVLMKMSNGQILAHYSDGAKQFFTLIGPGNYRTTDGFSCNFTVTQNLEVVW